MRVRPTLVLLLLIVLSSCSVPPTDPVTPSPVPTTTPTPSSTPIPTATHAPTRPRITQRPTYVPTSRPATPVPPTATPVPLVGDPLPTAATARQVELLGHVGGGDGSFLARGPYGYTLQDNNLAIWDVTDPVHFRWRGSIPLGAKGYVYGVYVTGDLIYVYFRVNFYAGFLSVVDISDPAAPVLVGSCDLPGQSGPLVVRAGYLYVLDWNVIDATADLRIIDVRDLSSCTEVTTWRLPREAWDLDLDGEYLYVSTREGFEVIDLQDPRAPALAGTYQQKKQDYYSLLLVGPYAYLGGEKTTFVVDVSDPRAPVEVNQLSMEGRGDLSLVVGDYLYVTDFSRLRVIDISDPRNPAWLEDEYTVSLLESVDAGGDLLYLVDWRTIHVLRSSPGHPFEEIATYDPLSGSWSLAAEGDHVYLIQGKDGPMGTRWGQISVVDTMDPAQPRLVGAVPLDKIGQEIVARDGLLYAAEAQCEFGAATCEGLLAVFDVTKPTLPELVGQYELTEIITGGGGGKNWGAAGVEVEGNYAYLFGGPYYHNPAPGTHYGLIVADVSDLAALRRVGAMTFPEGKAEEEWWLGKDLAIVGRFAYVAAGEGGVRVVDVSDPTAPVEVGAFREIPLAPRLAVSGDYAYVADRDGNIWVLDMANPAHPAKMGCYALTEPLASDWTSGNAFPIQDMVISGGYLYVAAEGAGLYVLDLADPAAPTLASRYPAGAGHAVAVQEDLVYLLGGYSGLYILRVR